MPYYEKSEDWLHQSALLLQARPSTTRITTRYSLKPARRLPKSKSKTETTPQQPQAPETAQTPKPPRGHLVLKTYDPASGVTLKYKTSKAAEVTRLVQMLGTLGKRMAAVPVEDKEEKGEDKDVVMGDTGVEGEGGSGVQTPVTTAAQGQGQQQGAGGAGGGGKGKKKKGKR